MKINVIAGILILLVQTANSQTYLMSSSGTNTITTCSGKVYDSGGPNSNYTGSSDATLYIQPDRTKSSVILQVNKLNFETCCDYLGIFPDAVPASFSSENLAILNKSYLSSDQNGKIALRFRSDGSVEYSGFEITIGCISYHDTADLNIVSSSIPDSAVITDSLKYELNIFNDYFQSVTGNISVKTFISSQNNFGSSFLADSLIINNIPSGGLTTKIAYYIPDTLKDGIYYIFSVIDANNTVEERNETDNIFTSTIRLVKPEIDLSFSNFNYNGDYLINGISTCSYYINSLGNRDCEDRKVQGFISKDKYYSSDDITLTVTSTRADMYSPFISTLSFPDSVDLADSIYYLLFNIKSQCEITETDTSNNWIKRQVIVCTFPIDLSFDQAQTNEQVISGGADYINYTLSYKSLIPLNTTKISFYLSVDTVYDKSADTLLQDNVISWYWNGSVYQGNTVITYPLSKQGHFYILCIIDADNVVNESNENNNSKVLPVNLSLPYYDLEILSNKIKYFKSGNYLTSSIRYKNSGNLSLWDIQTGFYLSTDSILDINDQLINSQNLYVPNPGSISDFQTTIYFNSNINPLNKYLITRIDYTNNYDESNEQNNYSANLITELIPSDNTNNFIYRSKKTLIADSGIILDNGDLGSYMDNSYDTLVILPATKNAKINLAVNSFQLEGCCDYLTIYYGIISDSTTAKYIQQITSSSQTFKSDSPTGAISLIFRSDGSAHYAGFELYFDTAKVSSQADFEQKQFDLNKNIYAKGEYVTYQLSTMIYGLQPYGYLNYGFYLSNDSIYDINDNLISSYNYYYSDPSISFNNGFNLPSNIDTSHNYIICKADYNNAYLEDNEDNNYKFARINIVKNSLDLIVNDFNTQESIYLKGNSNNLFVRVIQNGILETSGNINSSLYLSKDMIVDASDVKLSTTQNYVSEYSSELYVYFYFTMHDSLTDGFYYFIPVINEGNSIPEMDTTNNRYFIPIGIVHEENDLTIIPFTLPDTILTNNYIQKVITVTNIGNTKALGYELKMYLSKDQKIDNADLLLNSIYSYNPVQISGESNQYLYFSVSDISDTGQYYVISRVSSYPNPKTDMDTSNNILINPIYLRRASFDLYITDSNSNAPSVLNQGTFYNFYYMVYNIGPDACNYNNINFKVYLSKDNKIDNNDNVLYSYISSYYINPSEYVSLYTSFILPVIDNGDYYLIAKIESSNESDYANNIAVKDIIVNKYMNDLVLTEVLLTDTTKTLTSNSTVEGSCTIRNDGVNNLSGFTIGLYLSSQEYINGTSTLVWSNYCNNLPAGTIWTYNFSFETPSPIPVNTKYLIMKADIDNDIYDDNRQNNLIAINVNNKVGINDIQDNEFSIYPNPVLNKVIITLSKPISNTFINIYSIDGELIVTSEVFKNQTIIDMGKFSDGCYIVSINSPDGIKTYKIIKQ